MRPWSCPFSCFPVSFDLAYCEIKESKVTRTNSIVTVERIEKQILLLRGHKVMLDSDLANLYGVPTKALNQAVKRNKARFPADFMFRLTKREKSEAVTICDHLRQLKFSPSLP